MLHSSLLEGCGNSDHGGDSSPTRRLINILSIATILKKASNKTTTKLQKQFLTGGILIMFA